jgi:hypothetical protein
MPQEAKGNLEIHGNSVSFNGQTLEGEVLSFNGGFNFPVSDGVSTLAYFTYDDKKDVSGPHSLSGHVGKNDIDITLSTGCGINATGISISTRTNIRGTGTAFIQLGRH